VVADEEGRMTLWTWILLTCAAAFAIKLLGYLVPQSLLDRPIVHTMAGALTIALLASLTATNTLGNGSALALDSRLLGLGVAGIALWRHAPFWLVVVLGAVATALGRLAGLLTEEEP